jgi:hypothetical protein
MNTFKQTQNKREIKQQRKTINKQLKDELQKLSLSDTVNRNKRNSRRNMEDINMIEPVVVMNQSNEFSDAYIPSILTTPFRTEKVYTAYPNRPFDSVPNWYDDYITPEEINTMNGEYYNVCEEDDDYNMNFKHFDSLPTKDNKCNLYDIKKEGRSRDLYLRQMKAIRKYCKSQQKLAARYSSKSLAKKTVKIQKPSIRYIDTNEDIEYDDDYDSN